MSESSLAPAWKRSSLLSLADYHNGAAFNPSHWGKEGLPIIRIEQINNPSAPTDFYNGPLTPQNAVTTGDLIFSWSATLKAVIWRNGDGALNQHLFKVVPKNGTNKVFLKYVLEQNMESISSGSQGSTMKHITRGELQRYQVEVPELEAEQRRIAEILSTLDEAIGQTEALIAKHQQIKAGLMHDLFTRGITPDGHLRPTREQAPDLYKESPLGWMPKDWGCDYLQNLTLKIVDGVHHTPSYVEHGVPFVTIKNLTASQGIDFKELSYVTLADHHEFLKRADPKPGDVLVTKDGTLGVSRIVEPFHPEFSIFVSVAQLRPIATRLRPQMLHSFFDSGFYEQQMGGLSAGSGLKHIHLAHFRRFQIPLPSPNEQDRIAAITFATNERLASEMLLLAKLRQQKHGLMHDLLTGCVRIPAVKAKEVSTIVHTSSDLEPNT